MYTLISGNSDFCTLTSVRRASHVSVELLLTFCKAPGLNIPAMSSSFLQHCLSLMLL